MAKQEPHYYYPRPEAPVPTAPPLPQSTGGHAPPPTLGFSPPYPAHGVPPPISAASSHPPQLGIPIVPQIPPIQGVAGQWSTELCDCGDDVGLCCLTCWCPCITFGRIAEIVDRGSGSCGTSGALYALILGICASMGLPGLQCIYSCSYRSKMRAQYNLTEYPCVDCCVHFCCEACALCQEYRELRNRGYDMSIGWEANRRRFQDAAAGTAVGVPPLVHGGMNR